MVMTMSTLIMVITCPSRLWCRQHIGVCSSLSSWLFCLAQPVVYYHCVINTIHYNQWKLMTLIIIWVIWPQPSCCYMARWCQRNWSHCQRQGQPIKRNTLGMRMIMSPRLLNIPKKKNFVDVFHVVHTNSSLSSQSSLLNAFKLPSPMFETWLSWL